MYFKFIFTKFVVIEKLNIEHLAPYLPYELELLSVVKTFGTQTKIMIEKWELKDIIKPLVKRYRVKSCKPILYPLSHLTKEIEVNGEMFTPIDIFWQEYSCGTSYTFAKKWKSDFMDNILFTPIGALNYDVIKHLFEWHFDIFGLIKKGLAIDKTTLK